MTSLFKDFDKDTQKDAITRYVNTPTVELLYETDKKAVDAFLDGDTKDIKTKAEKLSEKDTEALSGAEQLYLRVASILPETPYEVAGTEGLFSTVWSLIKRFLSMIGNFFKWLGETFFGFGKRSQTDFNKLKAKVKAGEINYDTELSYPANAKNLLNSRLHKTYPDNLDWLSKEMDNLSTQTNGILKCFTEAKTLFASVQDKKVTIDQVARFGANVASALQGKLAGKEARLVGSLWFTVTKDKDNAIVFTLLPAPQVAVTKESVFKVSEGRFDGLVDKMESTSKNLIKLAELSKSESALFNIKLKNEKDLTGIGKSEAYAMAAAFRSLVNFFAFIKSAMTSIQHADTAAHDILGKAFR